MSGFIQKRSVHWNVRTPVDAGAFCWKAERHESGDLRLVSVALFWRVQARP